MTRLNRDTFLAYVPTVCAVRLPGTDLLVHVRQMTDAECASWLAQANANRNQWVFNQAHLIARCLCDENGVRVFSNPTPEDLMLIHTRASDVKTAITAAAMTVNGIAPILPASAT